MSNLTFKEVDCEVLVFEVLKELGVSSSNKGYKYVKYILEGFLLNKFKENHSLVYVVYPDVARHFEVENVARIERCIRHIIEVCFKDAPIEVLEKYFGNVCSYTKGKCTNKQFIYAIVEYIKVHHKHFS